LRPAAPKGDAAVRLVTPAIPGAVADDLTFRVATVPSGIYVLSPTRTGYFGVPVRNVVVLPGLETDLGDVELTDLPPLVIPDGGAGGTGGGSGTAGGSGGGGAAGGSGG